MAKDFDDDEWNEEAEQTTYKKRASHIRFCCAEGCTSKGYRLLVGSERVQYFPFPLHDKTFCARWAAAVKLPNHVPYDKAYVCSKHFRLGDYRQRISEDNKRSLRRTAIPSLEPIVTADKDKKALAEEEFSDDSSDDESNYKEITTLVSKDANDDNFTVLVVKDTGGSDTDEGEMNHVLNNSSKILTSKKVPLKCTDLLGMGPPFPWGNQDIGVWTQERLPAHEEHLLKIRDQVELEEENIRNIQESIDQLMAMQAHFVLKTHSGRLNVIQHFKQLK